MYSDPLLQTGDVPQLILKINSDYVKNEVLKQLEKLYIIRIIAKTWMQEQDISFTVDLYS